VSGGNPFYALELARARTMQRSGETTTPLPVPPSLDRLVAARLEALDAPTRRALRLIGQAEALFTVLRSLHRPVRLLRVPEETHELTRSGTPFRRVENLRVVVDWFHHFLVAGKRGLPPVPRVRGGR
jgi:hypothetical protein